LKISKQKGHVDIADSKRFDCGKDKLTALFNHFNVVGVCGKKLLEVRPDFCEERRQSTG